LSHSEGMQHIPENLWPNSSFTVLSSCAFFLCVLCCYVESPHQAAHPTGDALHEGYGSRHPYWLLPLPSVCGWGLSGCPLRCSPCV
jgi:hypothetical protein